MNLSKLVIPVLVIFIAQAYAMDLPDYPFTSYEGWGIARGEGLNVCGMLSTAPLTRSAPELRKICVRNVAKLIVDGKIDREQAKKVLPTDLLPELESKIADFQELAESQAKLKQIREKIEQRRLQPGL